MNQENGKGIIFGILGILTLIIAIMGASLAYFTASASAADEEIKVTSATVTIHYLQGDTLTADQLIPSDYEVVKRAYNRQGTYKDALGVEQSLQCKDDRYYQVCSVFRFKASNKDGRTAQAITGKITTITEVLESDPREFQNLRFAVFQVEHDEFGEPVRDDYTGSIVKNEIGNYSCHGYLKPTTDPEPVTQLFNHCTGAEVDEVTNENPDNIVELEAGEIGEFEVVIWLDETNSPQDEQGLAYKGQLEIGVSGASSDKITGQYNGG